MPNSIESTQTLVEKWTPVAVHAGESQPGMPVTVLLGEALDLSHFIQQHWEPITGEKTRPGMKSALVTGLISETTFAEIHELVVVLTHAHARYRAVNAETLEAPVDRGEFLLSEIRQSLEFVFDDGENDVHDAELARLSESHSDTSSHDALAMSLEGFAYYADRFRDRLAQLPEFDVAVIDEALTIASRLRAQSSLKLSSTERDKQNRFLSFRNQIITLLIGRMNSARRAARYVFRNHPAVARLATSGYERRGRARRRAAQNVAHQEPVDSAVSGSRIDAVWDAR